MIGCRAFGSLGFVEFLDLLFQRGHSGRSSTRKGGRGERAKLGLGRIRRRSGSGMGEGGGGVN